jgi:5-hydroxyisourate hydrolase-like protein (transthyretin family)
MRNKLLLTTVLLLGSMAIFANTGGKERKEDPDMNGIIIQSESGRPLKDVSITAYNATRKEKTAITDANGNFSMADLKPGVYKFIFQKDGFKRVIKEKIILKTNEDYQLNIEMAEEVIYDLMPSPLRFNSR